MQARWMSVGAALASAFVLAAGATGVRAQQMGRIQGEVVAADTHEPIGGAQVYVPGTSLGTLTNESGRFLLLNVPSGDETVAVQMIGYSGVNRSVTVSA
ncbi:MAG TPA: carboxypeptidase-like regulatory domain-containing protein, partial [Longimicrobiales bacterium]|nr:carboxypeptidase-like regulatory domain-containing protein [Longimicrobiales bacterium]